jgi:hypothetical protein
MKQITLTALALTSLILAGCASTAQSRSAALSVPSCPRGDGSCCAAKAAAAAPQGQHYYSCAMSCVQSAKPGPCPKCGMTMTMH